MWICIHYTLNFLRKIPLLKLWGQFNNMYFIFIEIDSWKFLCTIDLEKLQRLARSTTLEMVFSFQNCSDLQWEKKCCSDWEKVLKLEAECCEFANFLRSLEQFIGTVKRQNSFWNTMLFKREHSSSTLLVIVFLVMSLSQISLLCHP